MSPLRKGSSFAVGSADLSDENTFCFDKCGRADLESAAEAADHTKICSVVGPCENCGKATFTTWQGFFSHQMSCHKSSFGNSVSLRPSCLDEQRKRLSDFNWKLTEAIELIEVAPDDINELAKTKQRGRTPKVGDIGIRCVYCARKGTQPAGSNVYPTKLKTLPHSMYNLVVRHLIQCCQNIPKNLRGELIQDKKITTSQSMEKGRIGLPVYLQMISDEFGLADCGQTVGVRCYLRKEDLTEDVVIESNGNSDLGQTFDSVAV